MAVRTHSVVATAARMGFAAMLRAGLVALCLATGLSADAGSAAAQSWWPFGGGNDEPKRPREPVYRPDPQDVPAPIPQPQGAPAAQSPGQGAAANWSTKNPICLQLEQRLVQEGQKGSQSRDQLPKIEAETRIVDRAYNAGASQLDHNCYEYFLFTKTFRNTAQCKDLARQVDVSKRRLAELEAQRQDIVNSSGRSYQDDIIRELARNNCGANYVDQARRSGGFWQDEESAANNSWSPQGPSGAATFRTVCVRLCDGYFFPVSFSTLPSHFPQDADSCTSKCAAPTELYYYPNPGGTIEQAVALKNQESYTKLKAAFRYRKEFVNGCSCKEAEYVPAAGAPDKKAEGSAPPSKTSAFPARRADAGQPLQTTPDGASQITTGSTPERPAGTAPVEPVETQGWEPQQQ